MHILSQEQKYHSIVIVVILNKVNALDAPHDFKKLNL